MDGERYWLTCTYYIKNIYLTRLCFCQTINLADFGREITRFEQVGIIAPLVNIADKRKSSKFRIAELREKRIGKAMQGNHLKGPPEELGGPFGHWVGQVEGIVFAGNKLVSGDEMFLRVCQARAARAFCRVG